jgi:hypothetical protein
LSGQQAKDINEVVGESLDKKTMIFSDKAKNFVDIPEFVEGNMIEYSDKQTGKDTLKWVHLAISNAKRMFLGIYHWFHGSRLQNYLNEFCYKLNIRHIGTEKLTVRILQLHQAYIYRLSNI